MTAFHSLISRHQVEIVTDRLNKFELLLERWDGLQLLARDLPCGNLPISADFPGVVESISRISAKSTVIDEEVISVDDQGRASFQNLQKRSRRSPGQMVYYAFDLLWLKGKDLRMEPLQVRKKLLAKIVPKSGVLLSANLEGEASAILDQTAKMGLEEVVSKRPGGAVAHGSRST